jgi:hypothetical protein
MNHQISSQLAHELRSPLAAVIGTIDTVVDSADHLDPPEVAELLSAARNEAEHLLALVERARGRKDEMRPVVLVDLARRVLERFPEVEGRTYIRMDRSVVAWGEPGRIDQILTNLFQNVHRYAPEGDVEIEVKANGTRVELYCHDGGPGVDSANAQSVFLQGGESSEGLHLGLSLSRRLARELGGDLELVLGSGKGATFRLSLPATRSVFVNGHEEPRVRAPRIKQLVELADALSGRSVSRVEGGLHRIGTDLFGTTSVQVLVRQGEDYIRISGRGGTIRVPAGDPVFATLSESTWAPVTAADTEWWRRLTGTDHGGLVRMESPQIDGVLALAWEGAVGGEVDTDAFEALGVIGGLAIERAALSTELANERLLRSTVMDALPIAVSIFAGDPPQVIDQNQAEIAMLGLVNEDGRADDLDSSQHQFDVRFVDGTPLTVENAPVTRAIRRGRKTGPFFLRLRRVDGTEIVTRTYCAPFTTADGEIAGAVVTSEPVSGEWVDQARTAS